MKTLTVVQHTFSEHLGLIEDHLEGRGVRFRYVRPFQAGSGVPKPGAVDDGLILLGGGPWGAGPSRTIPTLNEEIALARDCLMANRLIIGIGLGAQILALAADGAVKTAPLAFVAGQAQRTDPSALGGYLPERFPYALYMRDWPAPPAYARVLAQDASGAPLFFQMGHTAFGLVFHPGFKSAMAEDLIMEFDDGPIDPAPTLEALRDMSRAIEDALVSIMTGLVQESGLMR